MIGVVMLILALAPEVVVTNPAWTRPPDPEQLAQPMPPFAVLIGVDGDVTLDCIAPAEPGPPKACRVVSATVTGLGFEDKARVGGDRASAAPDGGRDSDPLANPVRGAVPCRGRQALHVAL